MRFEEACGYIASLRPRGWRLGLDRMTELLRLIGNPHIGGPLFYHVAGTNGKGSVTAMIQCALSEAGYRTGSYFSPYVYDIRERIQVDGRLISEERFAGAAEIVRRAAESLEGTPLDGSTEFEFKTAMGFIEWAESGCDAVALEVGLGGRLDATNVVDPAVSVITEIGLDHRQYLGETIEQIATEKAGIIKPGKPVVSGVTDRSAAAVIAAKAREAGSQLWQVCDGLREGTSQTAEIVIERDGDSWTVRTPVGAMRGVKPGMFGGFQVRNAAAAVGALHAGPLRVSDNAVVTGIAAARLPGRMERIRESPPVYLDGAHNPQATAALAEAIRTGMPGITLRLVFSSAKDHEPGETLRPLLSIAAGVYVCEMAHERRMLRAELAEALGRPIYPTVSDAVAAALKDCGGQEIVLATGSFFLLSDVRDAIA